MSQENEILDKRNPSQIRGKNSRSGLENISIAYKINKFVHQNKDI